MSADKERDAFHINRVRGQELTASLTAQSYRPEVVEAVRTIKSFDWRTLEEVCENRIGPGPHPRYAPGGHPCVKTQNVSGLLADSEPAGWVELEDAKRHHKYLVQQGNILLNLTGAGSIGRASVYLGDEQPLTNQHIARLAIKEPYDSSFVGAFLNTWWGQRAIEQGISGATGQLNLVNDHVRALPIPVPAPDAQAYIGNKVRLAEALRQWSNELARSVDARVSAGYPAFDGNLRPRNRGYRARTAVLRDVLLADSYPPEVEEYFASVPNEALGTLCEAVFSGTTLPPSTESNAVEQATSRACTGAFIRRPCNLVEPPKRNNGWLQPYDIVFTNAAHDKSYIGRDYTFYHGGPPNFPSTKVMVIRVDRTKVPASYVQSFLLSPMGYIQTQAAVRGVSAGVRPDDVAEIRIPLPHGGAFDAVAWSALDEQMALAATMRVLASDLTRAARLLVEALIQRRVSEAELVAAHHDSTADRALLARLTVDGIDTPAARPLFEDVDHLLELVAAAKQGEAA
jgi:type I restriction enzyme S subunit